MKIYVRGSGKKFYKNLINKYEDLDLITMLDNAKYFRIFDIVSGSLKWQYMLNLNTSYFLVF